MRPLPATRATLPTTQVIITKMRGRRAREPLEVVFDQTELEEVVLRSVRWRTDALKGEEENLKTDNTPAETSEQRSVQFPEREACPDGDIVPARRPGRQLMTLNFPNPSCSFDATKNRVGFWGYDNVIEISFYVGADALKRLCPEMTDAEAGFLKAFDAARKRIHEVAEEVYARGKRGSYAYVLAAEDF